ILLIDNDLGGRGQIRKTLESRGYRVLQAETGETGLAIIQTQRPSLVVLDRVLPQIDGLEVLRRIKQRAPETLVIMLAEQGEIATVVTAMKMGATDFLAKPFTPEELGLALDKVLKETLYSGVQRLKAEPATRLPEYEIFFAHSEKMQRVKAIIDQVADTDATVLIRGESGVGKGLVATVLHAQSLRRQKPFIKVNCAAMPTELLESEFFGYEKGAFTGAHRRKPGKFEFAHQGTIFLDEIGEMSPPLQAKLLQVLQDGEFSRLGGEQDVRVDVRVFASTNRDLELAVATGAFRDDLYYRLNVVSLMVPPLRELREEVPVLADYFLRKYREQYNRQVPALSAKTLALFQAYHWPGNIRELENFVKRIVVLESEEFLVQELKLEPGDGEVNAAPPIPQGLKELARQAAREAERVAIHETLQRTQWNRMQAAKLLRISYKALLYKMQDCGLESCRMGGPRK
ncbi:MAG: sigma-54 dependent transcriptional regulator, partial [candidate division NC10 bacterium]